MSRYCRSACERRHLVVTWRHQSALGPGSLRPKLACAAESSLSSVYVSGRTRHRPGNENKARRETADKLVGRVQVEVMRERLWRAENTGRRGADLSNRRPATELGHAVCLREQMLFAFVFMLCFYGKINVGNQCAASLAVLLRIPPGWVTSC